MADSTGQEEVYAWCKYFGYTDKALVSLNSIIGYIIQPLDSFRQRVYIAPLGLWLTLDAGTFEQDAIDGKLVRVTLSRADRFTPKARLRLQQPARVAGVGTYAPRQQFVDERDAFTIPLGRATTTAVE